MCVWETYINEEEDWAGFELSLLTHGLYLCVASPGHPLQRPIDRQWRRLRATRGRGGLWRKRLQRPLWWDSESMQHAHRRILQRSNPDLYRLI